METRKSVLVVCLSPAFQKTMVFGQFHENEVNRSSEYFLMPSGKGVNVARILTQLHRPAEVLTQLGGSRVMEFLSLCETEHIRVTPIATESAIRTCTTVINQERSTSTELVEEAHRVEESANEKVWQGFLSLLPKHDALVITGTKAKGYGDELYPHMVEKAKQAGKLVILDLKGTDLKNCLQFGPDIVKPNLSELIRTVQPERIVLENEKTNGLLPEVETIAKDLYATYGTNLVVSRGKYSTWVFSHGLMSEIPNTDAPVVNTIGCGDALTAGMTHKLLDGQSLQEAVRFGMECALKNASSIRHGL